MTIREGLPPPRHHRVSSVLDVGHDDARRSTGASLVITATCSCGAEVATPVVRIDNVAAATKMQLRQARQTLFQDAEDAMTRHRSAAEAATTRAMS